MGALIRRLVLASLFLTLPAWAEEPNVEQARVHYDRGIQLYEEGTFKLALVEFQRSYELAPTYKLLYYIGEASRQTGDFAAARKALERYLAEGSDLPAARRAEVERELKVLETRTAYLTVTADVEGAAIQVDGNDLPAGRQLVNAGPLRIVATKLGYEPASVQKNVVGGDDAQVQMHLVPVPIAATNITVPLLETPPPPAESKTTSTGVYVAWGTAGAFAVGTIITGIAALNAVSKVDDLRNTPPAGTAEQAEREINDARQSARTLLIAADGLGAAALLSAGFALFLMYRVPPAKTGKTAKTMMLLRGQF